MTLRKRVAAAAVLLAAGSLAFGNGLNLNGLGSRAHSMGGAYVGLASDFSSLFWNPAGLARIDEQDFRLLRRRHHPLGILRHVGHVSARWEPDPVDAKTLTKNYLGGMAAYVQPVTPNLVVALGVYTPSGLGAAWDGADMAALSGGSTTMDWTSRVGLMTIAPSIAYRVNDRLSFGASLNINYGMFDLAMYGGSIPGLVDLGQYTETETGWGLGATFGVQYQPVDMIRLGLVYRTSSTVKIFGHGRNVPAPAPGPVARFGHGARSHLAGLAGRRCRHLPHRPPDRDGGPAVHQLEDHPDHRHDLPGLVLGPADGRRPASDSMSMLWRDALQVRFGAEYMVTPTLAVRGGYYFDPSPAPDATMNILLPNYDFNGLTFGLGYQTKGLSLDFGVEYLMGKERTIGAELVDAMPGVYDMKILVPTMSVQYKF